MLHREGGWGDLKVTERYAIYFTPASDSPLWRFGTAVIGYDSHTGAVLSAGERGGFADFLSAQSVADPARYGFHATLRAPFTPLPATSRDRIVDLALELASSLRQVPIGRLRVSRMGDFLALVPTAESSALTELAARCVETFEAHRAPLTATDRARRLQADLSPRQLELLDRWGYPYVFEQFRFHMSLTGRLGEAELPGLLSALEAAYSVIDAPVVIDAISVLEQPARDRPFRIVSRVALRT